MARKVYYLPADVANSLLGRKDPLVPPRGLANVGGGDFREISATGTSGISWSLAGSSPTTTYSMWDAGSGGWPFLSLAT